MKLPEIISMGTLLVEGVRLNRDEPFDQSGTFAGPFPGDETPVYLDPVVRLDHASAGKPSSNPNKSEYLADTKSLRLTGCSRSIAVSAGDGLNLKEAGRFTNVVGLLNGSRNRQEVLTLSGDKVDRNLMVEGGER